MILPAVPELYRSAFEIDAPLPQVSETVRAWAADLFDGPEPKGLDEPSGSWRHGEHSLEIWSSADADAAVFNLQQALPAPNGDGRWWIELKLAAEGGPLFAEAAVRHEPASAAVQPNGRAKGFVKLRLVRRLIDAYACSSGGLRLSNRAALIEAGQVERFLQQVLLNPARRLPVAAASRHRSGQTALDADALQRDLAGAAVVAVWDGEASRRISGELGRQFACYDGAVRVYRPGLSAGDSPGRHRFTLWSAARNRNFAEPLRTAAARIAAESAPPSRCDPIAERIRGAEHARLAAQVGELTQALEFRAAAGAQQQLDVDAARAAIASQQLQLQDQQAQLARIEAENERLKDRNALLEQALDRAAEYQAGQGGDAQEVDAPETVAEAVALAEARCRHLELFDNAAQAAGGSHYQQPGAVFEQLQLLDQLAAELAGGSVSETQIVGWLRTRGADVSGESQDTMHRYGDERQFRSPGGHLVEMQLHIKLGGGRGRDANCRIHFAWSAELGKLQVGHVGRHLQTSRS